MGYEGAKAGDRRAGENRRIRPTAASIALALSLVALSFAAGARAVQPPNPNDPCAKAGRNICGTSGTGFYKNYRYGIRWFGDYSGVVAGLAQTFCIDLGYWYPSAKDKYKLDASTGLRNSRGKTVSLASQEKIAYAIWAFGRSSNADRDAAVMLYVHSLMGDARPGEVDASAISPTVDSMNREIAASAGRFHGPYRIAGRVAGPLRAGHRTTASVRVVSGAGASLPNVELSLAGTSVTGLPKRVTTDANGVATLSFSPTASKNVTIAVTADALASTRPTVYKPTTAAAAANAQRIVAPTSQQVEGTVTGHVVRGHIAVTTAATPAQQVSGHVIRDHVTITGATADWRAHVTVTIAGPYPSQSAIDCVRKAWTGTFATHGPGDYTTPNAAVMSPGWYVFRLRVPGDAGNVGVRTPCNEPSERFFIQAQPTLATAAGSTTVAPGTPIFDRITVGSLAGTSVSAVVDLYGPFSSSSAISCSGTPVWSGSVSAKANGTYKTGAFTATVPGVYAYQARIASTSLIRGTQNTCGESAETTVVSATPKVTTHVSSMQVRPGSQITDRIDVSGSGAVRLTITDRLYGPFASRGAISCNGNPIWTGNLTSTGDGSYTTTPVTLQKVGYYVYRESIPATSASAAFAGKCGQAPETTLASSKPTVTTNVSNDVVRPGASLSDSIHVSGLGQTQALVQVQLFGPFATKAAIRCSGKPYSQTAVTAQGDGDLRSPPVKIAKAGFYTFHETLVGRDNVAGASTTCADTAETSLGAPAIITGRGDRTHLVSVRSVPAGAPTRVRVPSLGIDAPVFASAIDISKGELGVPADIDKAGWWSDGAVPGDATGSVVIAGHVDSAQAGAGAFFPLKSARPGTLVEVSTTNGQTKTYKVTSVKTMLKANLPTNIWSQKGRNHLVLVTCGGPFDPATGHYRDNVVVTAVPA